MARRMPIKPFCQCFARYTTAMARVSPEYMSGFMSHMSVALKAFMEVQDLGWCIYDEVFRVKMVASGVKQ